MRGHTVERSVVKEKLRHGQLAVGQRSEAVQHGFFAVRVDLIERAVFGATAVCRSVDLLPLTRMGGD